MSSSTSMIGILCLGFLLLTGFIEGASFKKGSSTRHRRSLMNLSTMVTTITGKPSTDFISYGNYCGLGGSGYPVDGIDQCCQFHDLCYNYSSKGVCKKLGEKGAYQTDYKWSQKEDGYATCDKDQGSCEYMICSCDATLTNCLKQNLKYYNSDNVHTLSLSELIEEANYVNS